MKKGIPHGTCIIMIREGKKIYLGSDMNVCRGATVVNTSFPKIMDVGPLTIAVCGTVRLLQLCQFGLDPTSYIGLDEDKVLPQLSEDLFELWSARKNTDEDNIYGSVLVINNRKPYEISVPDLSYIPIDTKYYAMGSGEDVALGSLYETNQFDMEPEERIKSAITAANHFDHRIGKKVYMKVIDGGKRK